MKWHNLDGNDLQTLSSSNTIGTGRVKKKRKLGAAQKAEAANNKKSEYERQLKAEQTKGLNAKIEEAGGANVISRAVLNSFGWNDTVLLDCGIDVDHTDIKIPLPDGSGFVKEEDVRQLSLVDLMARRDLTVHVAVSSSSRTPHSSYPEEWVRSVFRHKKLKLSDGMNDSRINDVCSKYEKQRLHAEMYRCYLEQFKDLFNTVRGSQMNGNPSLKELLKIIKGYSDEQLEIIEEKLENPSVLNATSFPPSWHRHIFGTWYEATPAFIKAMSCIGLGMHIIKFTGNALDLHTSRFKEAKRKYEKNIKTAQSSSVHTKAKLNQAIETGEGEEERLLSDEMVLEQSLQYYLHESHTLFKAFSAKKDNGTGDYHPFVTGIGTSSFPTKQKIANKYFSHLKPTDQRERDIETLLEMEFSRARECWVGLSYQILDESQFSDSKQHGPAESKFRIPPQVDNEEDDDNDDLL